VLIPSLTLAVCLAAAPMPAKAPKQPFLQTAERNIISKVNAQRQRHGLRPLAVDRGLISRLAAMPPG
jgi:hypothetical protein